MEKCAGQFCAAASVGTPAGEVPAAMQSGLGAPLLLWCMSRAVFFRNNLAKTTFSELIWESKYDAARVAFSFLKRLASWL